MSHAHSGHLDCQLLYIVVLKCNGGKDYVCVLYVYVLCRCALKMYCLSVCPSETAVCLSVQ